MGRYKPTRGDEPCRLCADLSVAMTTTDEGAEAIASCVCEAGFFATPAYVEDTAEPCMECPVGSVCNATNQRLATLRLEIGYWRASAASMVVVPCSEEHGLSETSCVGGAVAALCAAGHSGPLCRVCTAEGAYFDEALGACATCPTGGKPAFWVLVGVGAVLLLAAFSYSRMCAGPSSARRPAWLATLAAPMMRAYRAAALMGLREYFKVLFSFFQVAVVLESTYRAQLPPEYLRWLPRWLNIELVDVAIPPACVGRYFDRLLLQGLLPLALLLGVLAWHVASELVQRRRQSKSLGGALRSVDDGGAAQSRPSVLTEAALAALPIQLVATYVMLPVVASIVFAAFDCRAFDLGGGEVAHYLASELSVSCSLDDIEYRRIFTAAICFVVLWPVGAPLCFWVLLRRCRRAVREQRPTRLSHAARFLFREYRAERHWWEVLEMGRKLALVGFVLLIPPRLAATRLLLALVASVGYFGLVAYARPFRRSEANFAAMAAAFSLCMLFGAALLCFIIDHIVADLGADPVRVFGFDKFDLTLLLLVFTFGVLVLTATLMASELWREHRLPVLRLKETGRPPELTLARGERFHLFLSHRWAFLGRNSGQDQVAVLKRQLQLMLPGVRVFLDVDDLEDIGKLEASVRESAVFLVFLSAGYFESANCMREVREALRCDKPVVLLHETDAERGGAELRELRASCEARVGAEVLEFLFGTDDEPRPVATWHRINTFQLVTLRLVAEQVCAHVAAKPRKASSLHARPTGVSAGGRASLGMIFSRDVEACRPSIVATGVRKSDGRRSVAGGRTSLADGRGSSIMPRMRAVELSAPGLERRLRLARPVRLYVSPHNAGAESVAAELVSASLAAGLQQVSWTSSPCDAGTHALLYLHQTTFVGDGASVLMAEMQRMLDARRALVMVHELDCERGGCAFARFFEQADGCLPLRGLIDAGLFGPLALALHAGKPYRDESLRQILLKLGATSKRWRRAPSVEAAPAPRSGLGWPWRRRRVLVGQVEHAEEGGDCKRLLKAVSFKEGTAV